jgi:asparagine synthase (glutamine-hydrolysing)
MCGIYGITTRDPEYINKFIDRCDYRGPDGRDVWTSDTITLGHNLLSIMDTPENSRQPWTTEKSVLVYNGEIFNINELKDKYKTNFKALTNCDTELLSWGLQNIGIDFIDELDSMHGFAYYDKIKKHLILSVDHAGIKPLYYAFIKEGLVFGSEIKGLLERVPNSNIINPMAVKALELIGVNPLRETFFTNIMKVLPGETIRYDLESKRIIDTKRILVRPMSNHRFLQDEYRQAWSKAVESTLIGERKIGALLSGGLDSTTLAYEAQKYASNISYFTQRHFPSVSRMDEDYDSDWLSAKQFAKHYGLDLSVCTTTPKDYTENFNDSVYYFEEPVYNSSMASYLHITKHMKDNGITVALQGTLGDELLCGYPRHWQLQGKKFESWSDLVNQNLLGYIRDPIPLDKNLPSKNDVLNEMLSILPEQDLYNPDDPCASFQMLQCLVYGSEEYFRLSDKFGMLNSIETRFPFATKKFMQYAMSVPSKEKMSSKDLRKTMPRLAYKITLPEYIINKSKTGWDGPAHNWIDERTNKELSRKYYQSLQKNNHIPHWNTRSWIDQYGMTAQHNPKPDDVKGQPRSEIWTRGDRSFYDI